MNTRISATSCFVAVLLTLSVAACDSDGDAQRLSNLVTIADAGYTSLAINGDTNTVIETGGSTQLSLEAFSDGAVLGTTIGVVRADWSSADTSIAVVDSDTGIVVGGNVDGEVAITARFGNLTATTQVRISSAELESIIIQPDDAQFSVNECSDTQFTALGVFQGESEPRDLTDEVEWSVSPSGDSVAVAVFDEIGLLRVTSAGALTVVATRVADEGKPEVAQTRQVTVLDNLEGISIVPDAGVLANGSPLQHRAVAVYSELANQTLEITDNVEWRLDDAAESGRFGEVDRGLVIPERVGDGVLIAECTGTNIRDSLNIAAVGSDEFAGLNIRAENSARDFPLQVIWRGEEITEQLVVEALFLDREGSVDVTNDNDTRWGIDSSSNNAFFSIGNDDDNKGELVISGVGTVTVIVRFTDDDGNPFSETARIVSAAQ